VQTDVNAEKSWIMQINITATQWSDKEYFV